MIEPNRKHGRRDVAAVRRTCLTDEAVLRLTRIEALEQGPPLHGDQP